MQFVANLRGLGSSLSQSWNREFIVFLKTDHECDCTNRLRKCHVARDLCFVFYIHTGEITPYEGKLQEKGRSLFFAESE